MPFAAASGTSTRSDPRKRPREWLISYQSDQFSSITWEIEHLT